MLKQQYEHPIPTVEYNVPFKKLREHVGKHDDNRLFVNNIVGVLIYK